jgi:protoheme IX farnesyltransferase
MTRNPPTAGAKSWLSDISELIKTRLTFLVLMTTLAGFYIGTPHKMEGLLLFHTLFGTALVAAAASALNQLLERDHDLLMRRTADRPLAARRRNPDVVLAGSIVAGIGGMVYLALMVNLLAAVLAALTLASYVFLYTPLKRITTLNTLVGAIPGALPPVIGYAGSTGRIGIEAVILFAIMFFWQLPHFLAIAWMYRVEYREAGFKMLSGDDPQGRRTARHALFNAAALLPIGLLPSVVGGAGTVYFIGAFLLGLSFCYKAWVFHQKRDDASARQLFFMSIFYLPLLLGLLAWDTK